MRAERTATSCAAAAGMHSRHASPCRLADRRRARAQVRDFSFEAFKDEWRKRGLRMLHLIPEAQMGYSNAASEPDKWTEAYIRMLTGLFKQLMGARAVAVSAGVGLLASLTARRPRAETMVARGTELPTRVVALYSLFVLWRTQILPPRQRQSVLVTEGAACARPRHPPLSLTPSGSDVGRAGRLQRGSHWPPVRPASVTCARPQTLRHFQSPGPWHAFDAMRREGCAAPSARCSLARSLAAAAAAVVASWLTRVQSVLLLLWLPHRPRRRRRGC